MTGSRVLVGSIGREIFEVPCIRQDPICMAVHYVLHDQLLVRYLGIDSVSYMHLKGPTYMYDPEPKGSTRA